MPDFLIALLTALAVLVITPPVLRWAVRAGWQAPDRRALDRVYYAARGCKTDTAPFRRRRAAHGRHGNDELIDLDVDEWDDRT